MAMRKSERLMNLYIMLLVARRHLDKEHIRRHLYEGSSTEAFEKMFERDKDELRSLGIPIDMASQDVFFGDELGYRIHRRELELPDIALEADEAAVLGLAARVWQHAGLAGATADALVKLAAAGIDVDRSALDVVEPQLTADEPSFEAFWDAVRTRTPVRFDYQRSGSTEVATRHLQPWQVTWSQGRWYVVGLDVDRGAPRLFRLSRVRGDVAPTGAAGEFDVPEDVDLSELTRSLAPAPEASAEATVLVRRGTCRSLRRQAASIQEGVTGPDGGEWDRIVLGGQLSALADEVLSFGADARVEGPDDLREAVVSRLERLVR